ncbi:tetratricopeptide repeat protein [Stenotrophomonas sp. S48]|uniref:tetratricopeptide repeat protein n=1 Tax=unclassified Stenotrophomonas TaxID=196198 RepID=UPI0018FF203B|nr:MULTISPECIES: tetratricopeptide repeat protein [unclassified Stenotrophomonas]MBK0024610.1 tetratricopeptide repeat protein [Stenotrophomonas sp. S48]MBK0046601.1 tetratricopeptide repeat protein [Stenotrophomonas sp. S49]
MPALIRIPSVLLLSLACAQAVSAAPAKAPARAPAAEALALEPVIAGEFALQAGKLAEAARWYLQAAQQTDGDAGLAERATRIAMLANEDANAAKALALWQQRAPASLPMRSAAAALAMRQGNVKTARSELQSLLQDRDEQGWKFALAALIGGGRDPAVPAQVLGELVDANAIPARIEVWQEFGRLALRMEKPELAQRMIDEVVRRFPQEPRVALLRASQLQQAGQTGQALTLLQGVEPQTRQDPDLRNAVAIAYDSLGQPAAAERVLAYGPQDVQTWGMRASLLAKQGDKAALGNLYNELSRQAAKPDPAQRLLLGKIAEYLQRYPEAVNWYHSVPGGEELSEARLRAANAQGLAGRQDLALQEVHAIQSDATVDDDVRRDAYLLEAELRQRADDLPGELDALARGLAAYPDENALLYARGLAWERRDDIPRAEADLRKILVTEPENVPALNALGYTLADRTGRYQEALELIDRARVAEPDNAAIVDSYGWVLYRLGRNEDALVQLRRAWTLAKDPEIAAHVGEVLWVLGKHDEARHFFDEAAKLDPENRALLRAREKFNP